MIDNPTLTVTIDGQAVTIILLNKDSANVVANRLLVLACKSLDNVSQSDKDNIEGFANAVATDIADD